jgi:hypothetical protein
MIIVRWPAATLVVSGRRSVGAGIGTMRTHTRHWTGAAIAQVPQFVLEHFQLVV